VKDVFIDLSPMDDQLDEGGFDHFYRTFPNGSVVTLEAPMTHNGKTLVGWRVDGAPLVKSSSIVIVVIGESTSIVAEYGDVPVSSSDSFNMGGSMPTGDRPPNGQTPLDP
jgi:hypothetical protein